VKAVRGTALTERTHVSIKLWFHSLLLLPPAFNNKLETAGTPQLSKTATQNHKVKTKTSDFCH